MPKNMFFNLTLLHYRMLQRRKTQNCHQYSEAQETKSPEVFRKGKLSPGDGPFLPSWWENGSEIIFSVKSVIGRPYREQQVVSLPRSQEKNGEMILKFISWLYTLVWNLIA